MTNNYACPVIVVIYHIFDIPSFFFSQMASDDLTSMIYLTLEGGVSGAPGRGPAAGRGPRVCQWRRRRRRRERRTEASGVLRRRVDVDVRPRHRVLCGRAGPVKAGLGLRLNY